VAERGRFHRDENLIPVAELLDANKHTREAEQQQQQEQRQQKRAEALVRKEAVKAESPFAVRTPDEPRVAPSKPSRTAPRVLGVAAAIAMLAGGLLATQTFTKDGVDAGIAAAGPEHIRGAKVFRPDVIRASLNTGGDSDAGRPVPDAWEPADGTDPGGAANGSNSDDAGAAGSGGAADAADGPAGQAAPPAQQGGQARPNSPAPTTTAGGLLPNLPLPPLNPPATTTNGGGGGGQSSGGLLGPILDPLDPITGPILGPILGFYAAAPQEPSTAFALLDPAVQEGTVDEFAHSWRDVRSTEVEDATPDGDNAFIVRVSMLRLDGSRMLTQQRIVVGDGPRPKIVDAQLLSVLLR